MSLEQFETCTLAKLESDDDGADATERLQSGYDEHFGTLASMLNTARILSAKGCPFSVNNDPDSIRYAKLLIEMTFERTRENAETYGSVVHVMEGMPNTRATLLS